MNKLRILRPKRVARGGVGGGVGCYRRRPTPTHADFSRRPWHRRSSRWPCARRCSFVFFCVLVEFRLRLQLSINCELFIDYSCVSVCVLVCVLVCVCVEDLKLWLKKGRWFYRILTTWDYFVFYWWLGDLNCNLNCSFND